MAEIAHTSFKATLWPCLTRVHRRRGIGVFAGPPGLGTSTVARHFVREHHACALLVTVPHAGREGLRGTPAVQLLLEAVIEMRGSGWYGVALSSLLGARRRLNEVLSNWSERDPYARLTIVFDEAQNLSEEAIEAIRYLNDEDSGFSPFKVGLVFIGNARFRFQPDKKGKSILTEAVRDRALYTDVYTKDDIKDDDITLLLDAAGIVDLECHRLVLNHFRQGRLDRSLRKLDEHIGDLLEEAAEQPVTGATFRSVTGL